MLIRTWEEKDNLQVAKLEKQCFSFPWDYEMVSDTQSSPSFYGVVAEENQEVIKKAMDLHVESNSEKKEEENKKEGDK